MVVGADLVGNLVQFASCLILLPVFLTLQFGGSVQHDILGGTLDILGPAGQPRHLGRASKCETWDESVFGLTTGCRHTVVTGAMLAHGVKHTYSVVMTHFLPLVPHRRVRNLGASANDSKCKPLVSFNPEPVPCMARERLLTSPTAIASTLSQHGGITKQALTLNSWCWHPPDWSSFSTCLAWDALLYLWRVLGAQYGSYQSFACVHQWCKSHILLVGRHSLLFVSGGSKGKMEASCKKSATMPPMN